MRVKTQSQKGEVLRSCLHSGSAAEPGIEALSYDLVPEPLARAASLEHWSLPRMS